MSRVSTHILDQIHGIPASGIKVTLSEWQNGSWQQISEGVTNPDGRIGSLLKSDLKLQKNMYQILFDTSAYFAKYDLRQFYKIIPIHFYVDDPNANYHIPLLLSPYSYTTYRGS